MSTMTGSLPGLPPHSGLDLYRMDVDEYENLAGAGVLKDPRVELIDGYLVRKMTKKPRHTIITARPDGRNQTGRLGRLRNTKRLRALQSCPV